MALCWFVLGKGGDVGWDVGKSTGADGRWQMMYKTKLSHNVAYSHNSEKHECRREREDGIPK